MKKGQTLNIEGAKLRDYSAVLPLLRSLYRGDIGPNFKHTFMEYVRGGNGVVLIARESERIVGVLMGSYALDIDWEGIAARLDAMIVDEPFRRKGIGKKLLDGFVNEAKKRQCVAVKSRVNVQNKVAQSFHEKLGFNKAETFEYFLDIQEPEQKPPLPVEKK